MQKYINLVNLNAERRWAKNLFLTNMFMQIFIVRTSKYTPTSDQRNSVAQTGSHFSRRTNIRIFKIYCDFLHFIFKRINDLFKFTWYH